MSLNETLQLLLISFDELKFRRDEMLEYAAEDQLSDSSMGFDQWMKRDSSMGFDQWMNRVASMEEDVNNIFAEASRLHSRRCLFPWCCWANYELDKRVMKTIAAVESLSSQGHKIIPRKVKVMKTLRAQLVPQIITVGLDSCFEQVMFFLQDDKASVMGLYGMGGVGKTTLLVRINNHLADSDDAISYVLWVTVSRYVSMRHIQKQIIRRVGLEWQESNGILENAQNIYYVLSRKSYVLLLDDIWEPIDLASIGIPFPHFGRKSKILFTTRSEMICGMMEADHKLRVECLSWDDAWTLFQSKVGHDTLNYHPEIPALAKKVAKECAGLPLALITIGRVMSSKKTLPEWRHAISILKKHTTEFSGMDQTVFSLLKFSYDALPNESMRSCFLFCSLYPEGHEFDAEDLTQRWVGQNFIDESLDLEKAFSHCYDILEHLKSSCLLESRDDYVKMPKLIQDMAHWIACDRGKREDNILVIADEDFSSPLQYKEWGTVERISVMHTRITKLDDTTESPNLLTLLLCGNKYLTYIHDDFFISMSVLRFLDLSSNFELEAVPKSIVELVMLEYLDISDTSIKEVPQGVKNLRRLRCLFLNCIYGPPKVPVGVIGNLSDLRMLGLSVNSFGDCEDDRLAGIQELGCLARVGSLKIAISNVKELESYLGNDRLVQYTTYLSIDGEKDETRKGISSLSLSPSSSCTTLGYMSRLRNLRIFRCPEMEQLVVDGMDSLEKMMLFDLPKLAVSRDTKNGYGTHFKNLHDICIGGCDSMVNLTWLLWVPKLRNLKVNNCQRIQEIITNPIRSEDNTFSHLEFLMLDNLQNLQSICRISLLFPSLKEILVATCPELKRLPLDSNSALSLMRIAGSPKWWNSLEWENRTIKSRFHPFFTEAL